MSFVTKNYDFDTLYFLGCVKKQELYFFLFLDKSKHSILYGMIANENNIHLSSKKGNICNYRFLEDREQ